MIRVDGAAGGKPPNVIPFPFLDPLLGKRADGCYEARFWRIAAPTPIALLV